MIINKKGLDLVKSFEGCRLKAYKPVATEKYWTIGWGHYGQDVHKDMVITQLQADNMLLEDLKKYEAAVDNLHLTLNENQFSALVSFAYNCGTGNLKKLVTNRNHKEIADAILLYDKAGGKVLNGLVRRRKAERELFLELTEDKKAYPTLKIGMVGNDVKVLQLLLCAYGLKIKTDGIFGDVTKEAVMVFQTENKDKNGDPLIVDGIVEKKTWEALYK